MDQLSFPIKTRAAAWMMILIGGILGCSGLIGGARGMIFGGELAFYLMFIGFGGFIGGLLVFFPGLFLLKRKRWAWWFSTTVLIIELVIILHFTPTYPPTIKELQYLIPYFNSFAITILFLISLLLLFLDKKNFWKISL